jgi:hypothetical protein
VVAVIFALVIGALLLRRRRRKSQAPSIYADDTCIADNKAAKTPGPAASEVYAEDRKELATNELGANSAMELDSKPQVPAVTELGTHTPRPVVAELGTNSPQRLASELDTSSGKPVATELDSGNQITVAELGGTAIASYHASTAHELPSANLDTPAVVSVVAASPSIERSHSMSEKEVAPSIPERSSVASTNQLAILREEQAKLVERRKQLEELRAIDAQEAELQRRIRDLEAAGDSANR